MTDCMPDNKIIQERVYGSLQNSAYVEQFLARKFGNAHANKSPKPHRVEVYAGVSQNPRIKAKGEDFSSPASLNESLH